MRFAFGGESNEVLDPRDYFVDDRMERSVADSVTHEQPRRPLQVVRLEGGCKLFLLRPGWAGCAQGAKEGVRGVVAFFSKIRD